jgi:ParB family transcriptional regulator, chromosome partitioning protein
MKIVQKNIDEVIIDKRIRTSLGELSSLMKSMRTFGLMNPIIINEKNELIAGERRLESAKRLGWKTISATVVQGADQAEKLEMEIEENLHRRNLTPDELAEGFLRLEKMKNPGFFTRLWKAIKSFFFRIFRIRRT